jgi:hypothetical protein
MFLDLFEPGGVARLNRASWDLNPGIGVPKKGRLYAVFTWASDKSGDLLKDVFH